MTSEKKQGRPDGVAAYPDLARLLDYCLGLSHGRGLPHRKDFRSSRVSWMFDHLYLIDVLDGGADYRCRLWGQFWEAIFASNLQGLRLSDLEKAGHVRHLRAEYDAVIAGRQAIFRTGQVIWPDNRTVEIARVIIPFSGDDGGVSLLVCGGTSNMTSDDLVYFKGLGTPRFELDG